MFWEKTEKFCNRDFFQLSSDGFIKFQGGNCWNLLKGMSSNIRFVTFLGKFVTNTVLVKHILQVAISCLVVIFF
jgi:hypothetical protein